jgi:uncharacterized protein (TIGR00255 family)
MQLWWGPKRLERGQQRCAQKRFTDPIVDSDEKDSARSLNCVSGETSSIRPPKNSRREYRQQVLGEPFDQLDRLHCLTPLYRVATRRGSKARGLTFNQKAPSKPGMPRSMTGFGTGRAAVGNEEISVEVRSLNHKFCEVKVRLPREVSLLETQIVKKVRDSLARGAVEVLVKRQVAGSAVASPVVDLALARQYQQAFSSLAEELALAETPSIQDIITQPGVVRLGEPTVDLESAGRALDLALDQAVVGLLNMRQIEGSAIGAELRMRLELIGKMVEEVDALSPQAVQQYQQRLAERVQELASGIPVDPQRLAQEVAFLAERTDIAEELARLRSHLQQFRSLLDSKEPVGRRMDFVVQEMHREVNTTGAKSQHPEISTRIVALKSELERMREQVQNVE